MRKLTAIERNEQLRQAQEDSARLGSALQDILTDNIQATASVPEVPGRAVHLQAHARGEPVRRPRGGHLPLSRSAR